MPNYIKNLLTIKGSSEDVQAVFSKYSTHFEKIPSTTHDGQLIYKSDTNEFGWLNESTGILRTRESSFTEIPSNFTQEFDEAWTRFPDFNKIIEMPKSLEGEIGSRVETAVKVALKIDFHEDFLIGVLDRMSREDSISPLTFSNKEWNQFIQCLNNVREHGFIYWYDWRIKNWGTKWDASSCKQINESTYEFETAWSCVLPLIEVISKTFPTIEFLYEWSDEDTGSNCGYAIFLNGRQKLKEFENGSKEVYEFAFKLRPENKEYYRFIDGKYEYFDEEDDN